jgi:hypothetical protein
MWDVATQIIDDIITDSMRASEIVVRTGALVTRAPTQKDDLEINQAISEVIALTRSEVSKTAFSCRPNWPKICR